MALRFSDPADYRRINAEVRITRSFLSFAGLEATLGGTPAVPAAQQVPRVAVVMQSADPILKQL